MSAAAQPDVRRNMDSEPAVSHNAAGHVAPDCAGMNFYDIGPAAVSMPSRVLSIAMRASAIEDLKDYLLPKMLSTDLSRLWKGTRLQGQGTRGFPFVT